MLQRESSRNMSILLHNLSSVITSLKTLKPNIIHRTDHAHVFQNAPNVSFILLVFSPWSRIQLRFTQCICLLYLFSLTQCTKYDSPHHRFPPFFMMNESVESRPIVLQNVSHSGLVWYLSYCITQKCMNIITI